ncbi:MAG: ArdC-like ssDNA-binding domain-containing protein [Acidimicrobiales bacterium]
MAQRTKHHRTPQEREAKLEEAHAELTRAVAGIATSEDYQALLDLAARFHQYSAGNLAWLRAQAQGRGLQLTRVAGFRTWQALGREVEKGEHGFMVLAPVLRSAEDTRETTAKHDTLYTTPRRVCGFKVAYVFDQSQTKGKELKEPEIARRLVGVGPEGAWDAVESLVKRAGFTLSRGVLPFEVNGQTSYGPRTVVVREDLSGAQALKTLLHELAHIQLSHEHAGLSRAVCEVEAESVAYLVCSELGVNSSEYSFGYVASWAAGFPDALRRSADRAITTARAILTDLEAA